MNQPPPPLTDEELSAVLDGEAGPDVVARVRSDPSARARIDAFATAGRVLRDAPVTPLDATTVDRLVARSIEEVGHQQPRDGDGDGDGEDHDDAAVNPLAPGSRWANRAPQWLVAAAVVALVAMGLGLIWSGQQGGDDQVATTGTDTVTETSPEDQAGDDGAGGDDGAAPGDAPAQGDGEAQADAPDSDADMGEDAAEPGAAPEPDGEAPPTTAGVGGATGAEIADLGEFDSPDALRELLRTEFPDDLPLTSGSVPESPTVGAVERCRNQLQQVFGIEILPTDTGFAVVGDQPVLVYEFDAPSFDDGSPTTLVAGVGPDACQSVLTFER